MAIVNVKVPQLSESVAEATMLTWKKKAGEAVAQDEILIEIETDKVVLEVPAPSAGVLTEIMVGNGGTVVSDQVIAKIDSAAKATVASSAPAAAAVATSAAAKASTKAMPSAAKLMAENNLSAAEVGGSGKDGRVTKGDVLATLSGTAPVPKNAAAAPAAASQLGGA